VDVASTAVTHHGRGANDSGQLDVPVDARRQVAGIAVGSTHTLALRNDGTVVQWGDSEGVEAVPEEVQGVVSDMAAGYRWSMVLTSDDKVTKQAWLPCVGDRCSLDSFSQAVKLDRQKFLGCSHA
jgi:hypothetical protein